MVRMVHKTKRFGVDFSNPKSIKKAEREKTRLENKGYAWKSTKQIGFDKFSFEYSK